jgi:hypothetical protein
MFVPHHKISNDNDILWIVNCVLGCLQTAGRIFIKRHLMGEKEVNYPKELEKERKQLLRFFTLILS